MELRAWAIHILSADRLEDKLLTPEILTDDQPGSAILWQEPTRPPGMHFQRHSRHEKLPPLHEHVDPDKRAICLHRFAGHELLAVEIMAFALLAFPDAPKHFRRGVANTLREEQGHVRLYLQRLEPMGLHLEDLPHYRHFWAYTPFMNSPLRYVSVMSLTFENANLDFAPIYGSSFAQHGDAESATLMQQILKDEIRHVSFGWQWLRRIREPEQTLWSAWTDNLPPRMSPSRAKSNKTFFEEHRRLAGIPDDWIHQLKHS
ncbi:MAG: DUF455 family protein [Simkania sp.]|nr:DUF455 family protein [Simkania sp.]